MAASDVLLVVHPTIGFVAVSLFLGDVLGPVVECGNGLVSPAVHSQCFTPVREQYSSVFGSDSMTFGAFTSGAIVVWAEPELGRGLSLKMPFFVGAIGSGSILFMEF